MSRRLLVVLFVSGVTAFAPGVAHAQSDEVDGEGLLTGTVTDSTTGDSVPQATVWIPNTFAGTATDTVGRYRLPVESGRVALVVQAVGYDTARRTVTVASEDTVRLDVALAPAVYRLGTVTVEAKQATDVPSSYRLSAASLKNAPALGEPDVIRTAAFLPGVAQPNDMTSTINVRGGASDQNQFLIDGIEVYNPNHLFGILGPFNVQALEDVTVHAAQFPARHGGRLSSVIAMETRRPPDTTFARVNLSLVSASGVGARQVGDTDVTLAARRTYADPVLAAAGTSIWYNFHDLNANVTHDLGRGVSLEAIGFLSRDALSPRSGASSGVPELDVTWGGRMGALRLRHRWGDYHHRLTGSYVRSYLDATVQDEGGAFYDNQLRTLAGEYHGTWTLDRTRFAGGVEVERQRAEYGWREGGDFQVDEVLYPEAPPNYRGEGQRRTVYGGYVSVERHVGPAWSTQAGLRYSSAGTPLGGTLAPRLRVSYDLTDQLTFTATTGRYLQYVAKGEAGSEMTIEEPTFLLNEPQRAWTTTFGGTWQAAANLELGAESYHRRFEDVRRLIPTDQEPYPAFGQASGTTYGVDVFTRKTGGWITGQLSYSYTKTQLTLGDETYPPDWSIPHTLQGLLGLWLGDYWQFRMAGTWHSGLPWTPAIGSFRAPVFAPNRLTERFIEGPRNSARLPSYVRMDLSLRRTYEAESFDWTLYVQALNVLNRTNPLRVDDIRLLYRGTSPGLPSSLTGSLPVIPSIGVEFRF